MIVRVIKVLVGILLLPISIATTRAFADELSLITLFSGPAGFFLKGVLIYLIVHLVLQKPNYFYVLGHETAHAIATLLCGGRVSSFAVSSRGGAVATTKSNFFIALFPYFFPTYTLFVWLVYFIASLFRDVSEFVGYFLFLVGFSLTFHLVMTIDSMKVKQSDIFKTGYLFSVSLIYVLNILLVCAILSVVFQGFTFTHFFQNSLGHSAKIYQGMYEYLFL